MEVKELLIKAARGTDMCEEGKSVIKHSKSIDDILEYYIKMIDWSLESEYPKLCDIRTLFDRDILERHGIFIDRTFEGETFSSQQAYVFHNCKGYINVAMDYKKANIPMLYFANGCDIEVYCGQRNIPPIKVPLYIFGDNDVTCYDNDNAQFTIYRKDIVSKESEISEKGGKV